MAVINAVKAQSFYRLRICDLFMTRRCNFGCDYCFVHGKGCAYDSSYDTSLDVLKSAVRFLIRESGAAERIAVKRSNKDTKSEPASVRENEFPEIRKTVLQRNDPFSIVLFGGEPLLAFGTIVDFIPYARREFARARRRP